MPRIEKTYSVDLVRHTVLGRRIVSATSKKDAERKALPLFHKYDVDAYDEIWVEEQDDDDED